jgi:hypothetical protein
MKKIILLTVASFAIFIANAKIIYIDIDATGSADGTTWTNAYTNLQVALNTAAFQDELWIADGIYTQNTTNRDSAFQWTTPILKLYGGFNGTETTLAGRDASINKTILSGDIGIKGDKTDNLTTVLFGFYLRPGMGRPKGGDSTWIDGITIQDGYADDLSDLTKFQAYKGAAYFYSFGSGYVNFTNCHFTENEAELAGALFLNDYENSVARIEFYNCKFSKNIAKQYSLAEIKGQRLSGLNVYLVNCLITENEDTDDGNDRASLIYYYTIGGQVRANLYIHGCTIAGNKNNTDPQLGRAALIAGGRQDFFHQTRLEIVNSILYDNDGLRTYDKVQTWDFKPTEIHNCILESRDLPLNDLTQSDITSVDPKFVGGTTERKYAPGEGSPALNAAKEILNSNITARQTEVDIFGTVRVTDSTELGAIEYIKAEPIKTSIQRQDIARATAYPNPATSTISIKGYLGNAEVSITNNLGAEVLHTYSMENIDISDLTTGMYTLIIRQEDHVSQAKFVKN